MYLYTHTRQWAPYVVNMCTGTQHIMLLMSELIFHDFSYNFWVNVLLSNYFKHYNYITYFSVNLLINLIKENKIKRILAHWLTLISSYAYWLCESFECEFNWVTNLNYNKFICLIRLCQSGDRPPLPKHLLAYI